MTATSIAPGTSSSKPTKQETPTSKPSSPESGASSLYALGIQAQDIASEIALAADLLATDDPEQEASAVRLIESYLDAKEHTAGLIASKADNICRYIDHLQAMASFRKDQAKRLADLADADFQRAESLKTYMLKVLTTLHPDERQFSLPTHELRSRRSEAIVIDDEAAIPDEFLRVRTTYMPDKTGIKAAIKQGKDVPGARLEDRVSWSIK